MNCIACGRANLPGGLRCAYCGEFLPASLDFHVEAPAAASPAAAGGGTSTGKAGCLVSAAVLALKGKSLLTLLQFGKLAATFGSMLAFIWVDARFFGWRLGVGFAIAILIHEMGHVIVNKRKGIASSAPIFIPGLGALILVKSFPNDPTAEAECGAGGPTFGGLAALACLAIASATHSPFFYALALLGFAVNLFNLIPFSPLDGGRMASVFSPGVWTAVLVALLAVALKASMPVLWLLILVALVGKVQHATNERHNLAAPLAKARMGAIYLVLCIGLSWGISHSALGREAIEQERPVAARSRPATGAPQPETPPQQSRYSRGDLSPEERAITAGVNLAFAIVLHALPIVLWLIAAQVLRRPSGVPRGWQALRVVTLPLAVSGAAFVITDLTDWEKAYASPSVLAVLAAAAAALANSIYQANRHALRPAAPMEAQANCLGWAAGGALLVAYGMDSWPVALCVAACAAVFYRACPWVASHLLANLRLSVGDVPGALRCLASALARSPEPASVAALRSLVARLNLRLTRGGPALEAVDALYADRARFQPSADLQLARVTSLALVHRFDEAVEGCERLLHLPGSGAGTPQRLFAVHVALARVALLRGWHDEALAQIDWCLAAAPSRASTLVATLRLVRAEALCRLGRADAALQEGQQVAKISRSPEIEAWNATVRAECLLAQGDHAEAVKESGRAVLLGPGVLQALYWRGRALLADGRASEGMDVLRGLATDWRDEHWGRLAAAV